MSDVSREEAKAAKLRKKIIFSIIGAIICFASLWLGAYGQHALAEWARFPGFFSAFLAFIAGIVIAVAPWIDDIA